MAQSTRNRTKEFAERCSRRGVHRFVVTDNRGALSYIVECVDYEPAYQRVLSNFQRAADLLMTSAADRNCLPATYRYEFSEARND